jgi:hypothetical protein
MYFNLHLKETRTIYINELPKAFIVIFYFHYTLHLLDYGVLTTVPMFDGSITEASVLLKYHVQDYTSLRSKYHVQDVFLTTSSSQHHELCVAICGGHCLRWLVRGNTVGASHQRLPSARYIRTRIKVAKTALHHSSRLSLRCIFPRFNLHPSKCNNICSQQQQLICTLLKVKCKSTV